MKKAHPKKKPTAKPASIIVNGRMLPAPHEWLTLREVINLAYERKPAWQAPTYTVTYRGGPSENPKGTMFESLEAVKVTDGMLFNVVVTDKS